ncbi:MAG: OmpA family protein [Bacteroidia bacterium]|nr:OmpA family protein [Bacteroidia bacterium]
MSLLLPALAASQPVAHPGDASPSPLLRYTGRLLSLSAGAGSAIYQGEFDARMGGLLTTFSAGYAVFPELAVNFSADIGALSLRRTADGQDATVYNFQFGDTPQAADAAVSFTAFSLSAEAHLFPRDFFNVFLTAGVGVTLYQADDFNVVQLRPTADFPAAVSAPIGIGVEYFFTRVLSATLLLRKHFLFRGDFDAYDPAEIASEYNRRRQPRIDIPEGGNDGFLSLGLGFRWYLFESSDYDGDLLTNAEEEDVGTSPYHIDTDIDGLTDFDEVRVYLTSPLKYDTDDDGLGDYFEIMRYNTNPLKPDTDDDRLTDREEVEVYNTDPLKPDTDMDKLTDYEEVIMYSTNPRNPDTDYDGLDDYAEVRIHTTNPLHPDTDDDGIYDFNEIITYKTNPLRVDTDEDGLLDYDEIAYYGTNPLNKDTDTDGGSDHAEIFRTMTNPVKHDTGLPVLPDEKTYYAELLETRSLPGGGTSYLIAPIAKGGTASDALAGDAERVMESLYDSSLTEEQQRVLQSSQDADRYRRRSVQFVPPPATRAKRVMVHLDSIALKPGDILSFSNINFEFDRDDIRIEYIPILNEAARLFERHPGMRVEVRGHTDRKGEEAYNMALSERRSQRVKEFFVAKGIAADRLRTVGYGETQPIADGATEDGEARNRRVELFILSLGEEVKRRE